jgi:CDP-glucose 4,6-dehydratase
VEGVVTMTLPRPEDWANRRVFVTGHTGFKGSWLCLWLQAMGAELHGLALDPPTDPNLFTIARVESAMASHTIGDVRDAAMLTDLVKRVRPDVVFHLAAQPLVRRSYREPVETYAVNVMGTAHVLDASRQVGGVRAIVNVTTDKCYENRNTQTVCAEDDPLGGFDPYSSSKAASELVTAAYRRSFLSGGGTGVATARAGNVIGGGDWAEDRLIPDALRALDAGTALTIRSPRAVRPWQHVLEPLAGYLLLAERLMSDPTAAAEGWNFGPNPADARSVESILARLQHRCPALAWHCDPAPQPHESPYLMLDSGKAARRLGWQPRWPVEAAVDRIIDWHQAWRRGDDMRRVSLAQIEAYSAALSERERAAV